MKNIRLFEEQCRENLEILSVYKDNLEKVLDEEDHIFFYLTVTFGIDIYKAYIKWCRKAKMVLKDGVSA